MTQVRVDTITLAMGDKLVALTKDEARGVYEALKPMFDSHQAPFEPAPKKYDPISWPPYIPPPSYVEPPYTVQPYDPTPKVWCSAPGEVKRQ